MSPKAEGGLFPEGEGHLITNFPHIMVLVCNTMINEDIQYNLNCKKWLGNKFINVCCCVQ